MRGAAVAIAVAIWVGTGCGGGDGGPGGPADGAVRDGGGGADAARADGGTVHSDGGGLDGGGDAGGGAAADAGADAGPVSMPCTAEGECDPFDPESCPDGQSCRAEGGSGSTACMDLIDAPKAEGEACDTPLDCGPGLLCLIFGDEGARCHRMCPEGSIGFCGSGQACLGTVGHPCIRVCRPIPEPCDIYAQDCDDPDDTCTFARNPETGEPYTGCRPAGTQGHGEPCGGDAGTCGHGLVCIREGSETTCHHVCGPDGGEPECTVSGEECTGFARSWRVPYCR